MHVWLTVHGVRLPGSGDDDPAVLRAGYHVRNSNITRLT
jgi:hypothetical protein